MAYSLLLLVPFRYGMSKSKLKGRLQTSCHLTPQVIASRYVLSLAVERLRERREPRLSFTPPWLNQPGPQIVSFSEL